MNLRDPELIKTLAQAVISTVKGYTSAPVEAGALTSEGVNGEFGALIRFEGATLTLELLAVYPRDLLFDWLRQVLPTDPDQDSATDLAGEILNIAFGFLDGQMAAKGHKMRSSFPLRLSPGLLSGTLAELPKDAPAIPFATQGRKFFVYVAGPGTFQRKWSYTPIKPRI